VQYGNTGGKIPFLSLFSPVFNAENFMLQKTWKFLRVMFPRDEEAKEEERGVCKGMISEIRVKVSNVSLYVHVIKVAN
jgi:hypothetical protein